MQMHYIHYSEIKFCMFYSEQELCVELSQLSPDKVNSVVEEVLSKRGMSYLEPLEDLRTKFNVSTILRVLWGTILEM